MRSGLDGTLEAQDLLHFGLEELDVWRRPSSEAIPVQSEPLRTPVPGLVRVGDCKVRHDGLEIWLLRNTLRLKETAYGEVDGRYRADRRQDTEGVRDCSEGGTPGQI
jgi:hypothetical protein